MHYYFLEKDAKILNDKIADIQQKMLASAQDAFLQANQSAETWHDNFGFEDAVRQQRFLSKRISEIYEIQDKLKIVTPSEKIGRVDIGLEVTLENTDTKEIVKVVVGSYMVMDKIYQNETSYCAPIISPFFHARKGAVRRVEIGGQSKKYKIIDIHKPVE